MVLTEKGFERPSYDTLLAQQVDRAKVLFGEDIDTSETSVLGKFIRIEVQDLAECYELLEDIYFARFPNSARGQSLDRLCAFAGIVRDPATYARLRVCFYGGAGTLVPAAFLVSGDGLSFYVDRDYVIGEDGSTEAYINCTETGTRGNLLKGTELTIVNPLASLKRVNFLDVKMFGQEQESDTALRQRFSESISGSGSATLTAIRGAIARVPLVDGATIIENETDETVGGRPPHSFECYVLAPESQDALVAAAIFDKKPLGIKCVGSVEVSLLDDFGKTHTIRFSRTVKRMVMIKAKILVDQYFETDGIQQIQDRLTEAVNGLSNGETVYLSGLYGFIHQVAGVVNVQELLISGDGTAFESKDIQIGEFEVARLSGAEIEVVS